MIVFRRVPQARTCVKACLYHRTWNQRAASPSSDKLTEDDDPPAEKSCPRGIQTPPACCWTHLRRFAILSANKHCPLRGGSNPKTQESRLNFPRPGGIPRSSLMSIVDIIVSRRPSLSSESVIPSPSRTSYTTNRELLLSTRTLLVPLCEQLQAVFLCYKFPFLTAILPARVAWEARWAA
jgi:hypothetical protein